MTSWQPDLNAQVVDRGGNYTRQSTKHGTFTCLCLQYSQSVICTSKPRPQEFLIHSHAEAFNLFGFPIIAHIGHPSNLQISTSWWIARQTSRMTFENAKSTRDTGDHACQPSQVSVTTPKRVYVATKPQSISPRKRQIKQPLTIRMNLTERQMNKVTEAYV